MVVHLWTSIARHPVLEGMMSFSTCAHYEPDRAALPPSAVLDAQMPPGPRANQPIGDDDELSDLDFAIADMVAAAAAANTEEELIAEQRPQASGSADRPRTNKARLASPSSETQAAKAKRRQARPRPRR